MPRGRLNFNGSCGVAVVRTRLYPRVRYIRLFAFFISQGGGAEDRLFDSPLRCYDRILFTWRVKQPKQRTMVLFKQLGLSSGGKMGGDRVPLYLRNVPYASMARWKVKRITTGKKEAPSGLFRNDKLRYLPRLS